MGDWVIWLSDKVRPYDVFADRRRWFWQKSQRCGVELLFLCDCPYYPCVHNPRSR